MIKHQADFDALLQIKDVCFGYGNGKAGGNSVLRDASFDVYRGEFLCLLGPSGCGKTTLLRLLAGLEKPHSGSIQAKTPPKTGMVFQDLALFPHMSVARNVGYALRHLSRAARRERIDEVLALVGLLDKRGQYPHELSGGQKQRLALARALARQPDIILLDEPFAAQDITLRAKMRDDVMHILRDAGVTALLVTHDPEEAMQFSDRIAIMQDGKIAQIGAPDDVYNNPQNAFVASFFGDVNVMQAVVKDGKIATPLGVINGRGHNDNTRVNVIIRPEALRLKAHDAAIDHNDAAHAHTHGKISERKYLGRSTLVHLDMHTFGDNTPQPFHAHARIPGTFPDSSDIVQDIFLDEAQIFVFEDTNAAA